MGPKLVSGHPRKLLVLVKFVFFSEVFMKSHLPCEFSVSISHRSQTPGGCINPLITFVMKNGLAEGGLARVRLRRFYDRGRLGCGLVYDLTARFAPMGPRITEFGG